jgi:hypothetical protein
MKGGGTHKGGLAQRGGGGDHVCSAVWKSHVCCAIYQQFYIPLCVIFYRGKSMPVYGQDTHRRQQNQRLYNFRISNFQE